MIITFMGDPMRSRQDGTNGLIFTIVFYNQETHLGLNLRGKSIGPASNNVCNCLMQ